jgi:hypothetical protein
VLAGTAGGGAATPRCFGAAARDPEHQPCDNPALRLSVVPSPADAQIEPSAPCTPVQRAAPAVCAFGVAADRAVAKIALVGDSHAVHWRAALAVVARANRWHGLSLTLSQCPFSDVTTTLPKPERAECIRWKEQVQVWLEQHSQVSTVFLSQNSSALVAPPSGQSVFEAQVAGYVSRWTALPASVRHLVVIHDVPHNRIGTLPCVQRTMVRRKPTGRACAVPRHAALTPDAAVAAAHRLMSPRVHAVDLTRFMCDRARCYPVVGGALVHRDIGHLTRVFATTLGPFLLRAIDRLRAS